MIARVASGTSGDVANAVWAEHEGGGQARLEWWVAGVIVALFLLFTHRVNLQRLRAGNEHRFEKARVLARLFAR